MDITVVVFGKLHHEHIKWCTSFFSLRLHQKHHRLLDRGPNPVFFVSIIVIHSCDGNHVEHSNKKEKTGFEKRVKP